MDNDSSAKMHIIPLVLIAIILVIVLCARLLLISPHADHSTGQTGRPLGPEVGIPEEEPLLPRVEVRKEVQPPNTEDTFAHLAAEINQWKDANTRKAEEIKIAHARIANLEQDLSTSVSQNSELQHRNESLARDLEGARLFLNTADKFSDSEVIQILQKLNAELQHTSTSMAEHVVSVFKLDAVTSDPEQQIMVDKATESIGSTLVQFLRTTRRDDFIEMHLQIAFQAYLTSYLCRIVSSWTLDEGRSAFINVLYERLRETEKQTISGRWRSLTRVYALPTCVSEPNSLITPIIAGLSHILLAVGCTTTQSDITAQLSPTFEKKILSAVTLAGRLNQMIGEVVSGDFEVFFHEGRMEDIDDSANDVPRTPGGTPQTVLCTSELGLTKWIQLGTGERETTTVIKAKVVPESFLLDTEN
ncbi:hypothetical protein HD554DRAFT_2093559 [Boletus coccyginus]|nr:hypothetical protein HD554DRAFT_2093559 [Boletus coccyginus]